MVEAYSGANCFIHLMACSGPMSGRTSPVSAYTAGQLPMLFLLNRYTGRPSYIDNRTREGLMPAFAAASAGVTVAVERLMGSSRSRRSPVVIDRKSVV